MSRNPEDSSGDAKLSSDVPDDRYAPVHTPLDAGNVEPVSSNDMPHVVYRPLPAADSLARRQKAQRRMERRSTAPAWMKKISWLVFPTYGIMRMHDKDFEEHSEHWQEQQRRNYDQ